MRHTPRSLITLLAALALMLTACPADDEAPEPPDVADPDEEVDEPDVPEEVAFDIGVTEEPCPDAVNPDNGCIYLGQLSDLTVGPFAPLAVPFTDGISAFWDRVNEQGGIGGRFDVDADTYTRDTEYNPEIHVTRYREIEPDVLALAQSIGSIHTLAALDDMEAQDVVGVPGSWWSGWEFIDVVLQSGVNYCVETMNGVDWVVDSYGASTYQVVHYPGDYGEDVMAGATQAGDHNDMEFLGAVETLPNAVVGDQGTPIGEIMRAEPDLVVLAVGPAEMAEIVGGAAARGFEGRFIGPGPTYNPGVLGSPAADAIIALYEFTGMVGPWGTDTEAHRAMQEAFGEDDAPANDGWTWGWVMSYPLQAVLEQAVANGDLTRAGVRAAVQEVTVGYEGALPDKTYAGDPNETVVREALIAQPDPDAPLGASVREDFFVGPTAADFDFTSPCVEIG